MVISMLKSTVSTVKRALSNISTHCHDDVTKILPSNETNKSTDTGGVELSVYPDSESLVAPPKVKDVLTGGKRKEGSKPTRRKKKLLRMYQAMTLPVSPLILRRSRDNCI